MFSSSGASAVWPLRLVALACALTGCGSGGAAKPSATVCVGGSLVVNTDAEVVKLMQSAADDYSQHCPGAQISVASVDMEAGFGNVVAGISDAFATSAPASASATAGAADLVDRRVVSAVGAVFVNPSAGVTRLSRSQVQDVFAGRVTNWRQVGGKDVPIVLIERGPGAKEAFDKDMMGSVSESGTPANDGVGGDFAVRVVTAATGGVSYGNVSDLDAAVTAVALDGVTPGIAAVARGGYPYFWHEHMYSRKQRSPLATEFIKFVGGPDFQGVVQVRGYFPLAATDRVAAADR